mgnify:CR=1 FL=1
MPDIVLTTLNAKYIHASFGLRYLLANMGELRRHTLLREYTITRPAAEIARDLLRTLVAICEYEGTTPRLTRELLDEACLDYFVS